MSHSFPRGGDRKAAPGGPAAGRTPVIYFRRAIFVVRVRPPAESLAKYTPDASAWPSSSVPSHTSECGPASNSPSASVRTTCPLTLWMVSVTRPASSGTVNASVVVGLNGFG